MTRAIGIEVPTESEVFGRDDELAVIDEFLRPGAPLPATLSVRGQAGIGKTTLWLHALALARERSFRVLSCSPTEAESELSFGGLSDLLGEALDEALAALPAPQAQALEVAFRRREPGESPPDQFAIRSGLLSVLRMLVGDSAMVVAVDDVQWLDRPSALALEFAARRLRDEAVSFVVARREEGVGAPPLGPEQRVVELAVRPLSLGAIHRLLRSRLGASIRRPVLRKIHETSGGNPFFALELGRELLQRALELAPNDQLPFPSNLDLVVRGRLSGLGTHTREVLLGACSLAQPSLELLEEAYGRADVTKAIDEAVAKGVIEPDLRRIRFSHPLLASACYAQALPGQRQRVHRLLAETAVDPEEGARQLALSESGLSRDVATALERAAAHAAERGAPETAAELAELALARTPPDHPDLARTLLAVGSYALRSGDARRARTHFGEALHHASAGAERAEALVCLAETEEDTDRRIDLCEQALAEPGGDAARSSWIHRRLARACIMGNRGAKALEHAGAALELAELADDPELLVATLTEAAEVESRYGAWDVALALLKRALALEPRTRAALRESPRLTRARFLTYEERFDEARPLYAELLDEVEQRGDEWARHRVLWNLAWLESHAGELVEADRRLSEALELAEASAIDILPSLAQFCVIAARLGRVEEAREAAERGLALAESAKDGHTRYFHSCLGFLELSLGDLRAAQRHLWAAVRLLPLSGRDGIAVPSWANEIETLIGLGEVEQARALLVRRGDGPEYRLPGQLALAARCRGLVLAAEQDLRGSLRAFETALAEHEHAGDPFERARTLLWYGTTLRRAKRRGDARDVLQEALAEFERLSTPLWAEKARAELARIGGRARSGELTATERRLAELVAEGRSNKEVAAALYLTPKTVTTQLSRIYAKLGIHSRAELVRHLLEESKV